MATVQAAASFFVKVYSSNGSTFRRVLDKGILLSVPRIIREVNKPAGEITLDLALPWDNFGYGSTVNLFDLVKVYAVNVANPGGVLVYQGHIIETNSSYDAVTNHVTLRLFPIDALMGNAFWVGSGYTVSYAGALVNTIFSDAIDDLTAVHGSFFTKNLGVPAPSISTNFVQKTHLDALNLAFAFLDATWYWRVRPNGQVDLQQYSDSTAVHSLALGKHVDSIQAGKSILDVKNLVRLGWGSGPTYALYSDGTSQASYGHRDEALTDSGIQNSGSADSKGNGEVARLKNPFTKTQITVNANYAIETILPGDTVKISNITSGTSSILSGQVLRIQRVEYDGSLAVLHLADIVDVFGTELLA
ncbi:MAG: hypothetical protein ABIB04_03190 [Patescibacteria group bacterium]